MKKRYLLIAGLCSFLLMSCDKFLELTPRDQKVVSTIEDYRDIMASYMRLLKTSYSEQEKIFGVDAYTFPLFDMAMNLGIYTGETNLTTNSRYYYDNTKGAYTNEGKNMLSWLKTDSQAWARYYTFLGPINLIISGIADAEGTDEDLRNRVKGEALVWRAFAYFKLLQYYAPYKDNTYGVPIYLTPEQDIGTAMPERKTQREVFARIFEDCGEALDLLDRTASSEWNCAWRNDFIHAMMASIYTWRAMSGAAEADDWENAEKCATEAMKGRMLSNTAEAMKELFDCSNITSETYLESDEFYFRIIDASNRYKLDFVYAYYENASQGNPSDGQVNQMYYSKFKEGDIRKAAWFNEAGTHSDKYNLFGVYRGGCLMLFRLAEMYLIKAEALVRQGKTGEAHDVLTEFCQARYTGEVTIPSDAEALLQEVLDERLREFYMENDFRWLDMKRLGVRLERSIGGERVVLEPDDFRYCFPIPARELRLNKNMVQTPGWETVVLAE